MNKIPKKFNGKKIVEIYFKNGEETHRISEFYPYYYIEVNYPIQQGYLFDNDTDLERIASKFGGEMSGAGTDFQQRDVSFVFYDKEKVAKFYKECVKKKIISKSYSFYQYNLPFNDGIKIKIK